MRLDKDAARQLVKDYEAIPEDANEHVLLQWLLTAMLFLLVQGINQPD